MKINNTCSNITPIKTSYKHYGAKVLLNPSLQLNDGIKTSLFDNLFFAQLLHATKSKHILDFGCYIGMLAVMVEELLQQGQSDMQQHANWTLIDNFSFLKDIKTNVADSTMFEFGNTLKHAESWKAALADQSKSIFIKQIPTTPVELHEFLINLIAYSKSPMPLIQLIDISLDSVNDNKFDMISFDLRASEFSPNFELLGQCVTDQLNDFGIVIMDDVKTIHPNQLAIFMSILDSYQIFPLAFGTGKIALIKCKSMQDKDDYLEVLASRLHVEKDAFLIRLQSNTENYIFWNLRSNPKFGKFLSMNTQFTD